jgi:hypothetical protein
MGPGVETGYTNKRRIEVLSLLLGTQTSTEATFPEATVKISRVQDHERDRFVVVVDGNEHLDRMSSVPTKYTFEFTDFGDLELLSGSPELPHHMSNNRSALPMVDRFISKIAAEAYFSNVSAEVFGTRGGQEG